MQTWDVKLQHSEEQSMEQRFRAESPETLRPGPGRLLIRQRGTWAPGGLRGTAHFSPSPLVPTRHSAYAGHVRRARMSALGDVLGILADQRVDALEVTTAAVRAIQAEDVRSGLNHLGNHLLQGRGVSENMGPSCIDCKGTSPKIVHPSSPDS